MQIFIHCRVTLLISGVTAPIIRSTKNSNRSLRYGNSYFPPTWPRWREVAVRILWPVPEAAVTVLSTPDDGCCDTRSMWSDFAVNKYLHTVASGWIFINAWRGVFSNAWQRSAVSTVDPATCPGLIYPILCSFDASNFLDFPYPFSPR